MLDYSFPQRNELHTFVSVVKRSPLFCAPNMGSMTAGILSFSENRILDDFQSLGVVRSFLSCFLFFSCLILFALFVLLGALKFLQLFVISYALYSDPADSWCGAWKGSDWLT